MTNKTKIIIALVLVALIAISTKPKPPVEAAVSISPASDVPGTVSPAAPVRRLILVHLANFYCPPCEKLKPEIKALRDAGWEVRETKDVIEAEADGVSKWPTIIGFRNDVEIFRHVGYLEAVKIGEGCNRDEKQKAAESKQPMRAGRLFRVGCFSCR
jgi:thiol-disulfide isomerase/thioredoxin